MMPAWSIILITLLFWAIWPGIIIGLHISEEKRIKRERTDEEKRTDSFLNKLKKGGK